MSMQKAIGAHIAAWQAFQGAGPDDARRADDRETEALMALLCTPAQSLEDAQALAVHLAWYHAEEDGQAGAQVAAFLAVLRWLPALPHARALLDAVDYDNNGVMVAGHLMGGNG